MMTLLIDYLLKIFQKDGLATELLRQMCKGGLIFMCLAAEVSTNLKGIVSSLFVNFHSNQAIGDAPIVIYKPLNLPGYVEKYLLWKTAD